MRRDNRNQIGCGLPGLTESFSNYIPSIFKKPENIGFDRLGNKNLRTSPSPPNNSPSLILLSPLAMDFLCPTESFLWGPLKINDEAQGVRSQEPRGLLGPPLPSGVQQPNTAAAKERSTDWFERKQVEFTIDKPENQFCEP
jgi:hypothetical protein